MPSADAGLAPGTRLGNYTIRHKLGAGGMATVYLAHQERLHRDVALKVLARDLATDASCVARFEREAQTAAGLSHPSIVPIYEIGSAGGLHYFSMEYVEGLRLDQYMQWRGPLDLDEGALLMERILGALAAAHAQGVVHRDIKPANIMLDLHGTVRVLDFGIATARPGTDHADLTQANMLLGTPRYMSPEQCLGQPVDGRSDLYALGAVAWAWWAGRPPFDAPTPTALQLQHCHTPAPALCDVCPDLPPAVDALVQSLMAKAPDDRPASAAAALEMLRAIPRPHRISQLAVAEAFSVLTEDTAQAGAGSRLAAGVPPAADPDPTPTYPPSAGTGTRPWGQATIEMLMLGVLVLMLMAGLYESAGTILGDSLSALDAAVAAPAP